MVNPQVSRESFVLPPSLSSTMSASVQPNCSSGFNLYYATQDGPQGKGNVVPVSDSKPLIAAMQNALDQNKTFSVVAGGHGYEGFGTSKEVVIDTSTMNSISLHKRKNVTYLALQGGCTLASIYEYLFKHYNTLIPGGSCWSVCAGGHITGGGYGIYSRDCGLTVDFLAGVEFAYVDKKKKVKTTTAWFDSSQNLKLLLWACRGGMGGNFGVILTYYMELPKMRIECIAPRLYYQLWMLLVPTSSSTCTSDTYKKLFRANYAYFLDKKPAFSFFRATSGGITMNLYGTDKTEMVNYLRYMIGILDDIDPSAIHEIQVSPGGGPHAPLGIAGPASKPFQKSSSLGPFTKCFGGSGLKGMSDLFGSLSEQILSFSFFDFVEANSGIPTPNSYFKNSGHVVGTPKSKEIKNSKGETLYDLGYTDKQLESIFEHIMQLYVKGDSKNYDAGPYNVYDPSTKKTQLLYLKSISHAQIKIQTSMGKTVDARPQHQFISQFSDGGQGRDVGSSFCWQHDPYNGKVSEWCSNATNPVPMEGKWDLPATSVSNRNAILKVQPQLYWNYKEDSPFFHEWFDKFTDSVFYSALAKDGMTPEDYPPIQGGYINYPDSHFMDMYPVQGNNYSAEDAWPHIVYGNNNGAASVSGGSNPPDYLTPLMKVKGMFDPLQQFNLRARAVTALNPDGTQSAQTAANAYKAIGIPPPSDYGVSVKAYK